MKHIKYFLFLIIPFAISCSKKGPEMVDPVEEQPKEFKISSSAFRNDSMIPIKFACDGDNYSPALKWENAPSGTKSFALIMEDPDAPNDTFVHWVVYNIPANVTQLEEHQPASPSLPNGSKQGKNGAGSNFYIGPCPPSGMHRYFFTVYALDVALALPFGKTKEELRAEMNGHILKKAEVFGKYQR